LGFAEKTILLLAAERNSRKKLERDDALELDVSAL
jgi:hypothetical protein